MDESIAGKALARLINVQPRLDRAALATEQVQSRTTAIGERLEQVGSEIVHVTAELDRPQRLRRP